MIVQGGRINRVRGAGCAFFLLLLAVCGYVGAQKEPAQTVSVDVVRSTLATETLDVLAADTATRLAQEREKEIAMLREVLADTSASEGTRENAAAQLTQITERMELEAQSEACLEHMGYEDAAAVCGAQMMTLLIPAEKISAETDKTRVFEAVSSLTGMNAADIKIILIKK